MDYRFTLAGVAGLVVAGSFIPAEAAFRPAECWFVPPVGQHAVCGVVVVPAEDRVGEVTLPVVVLKAHTANPAPDPILYLEGGPGASPFGFDEAREERMDAWWRLTAPLRRSRDVILFDPRGVGLARPDGDCAELDTLTSSRDTAKRDGLEAAAARDCAARMMEDGLPPASVTTPRAAADAFAVAKALNAPAINLLAISYGTRVAFAMLRDPELPIRSAVLDGVYPPDVNPREEAAWLARRGMERVFEDCSANRVCRAAHPELQKRFVDMIEKLGRVSAEVRGGGGAPSTRPSAGAILDALLTAASQIDDPGQMPGLIDRVISGRLADLQTWLRPPWFADPDTAEGVALSIECRETVNAADSKQIEAGNARNHPFEAVEEDDPGPRLCAVWPTGVSAPSERLPVASPVPTLLFSGAYDTVTPPDWGERAAATLPKGRHVMFRAQGHIVTQVSVCAMGMAAELYESGDAAEVKLCPEAAKPPAFPAR